ncbi:regulator of cell morphogenesis and NO signaling [Phenylobacterium zucineum HLK1]|uniref:Regulator of cell morphogenesis and NO signaling n=1 Tax=Phenylobacterium zucineum (strain HLK1) TaxID=450851 RepID=B4R8I3_PHEZH|nr:iron-sulfur cluster repair di-iron protein [Phenylobacterium zucineum]ACG77610.1 regulator of cell morphogenesis and NO signaling [Phenylobacterium zucineum HLK1]
MTLETTLVRDIAVTRPGATAVLRRHRIDFCCNGGLSLAEAAARRDVDLGAVARELEALTPEPRTTPEQPEALIEHILKRFHEVHRREFPEAIRMARRVEAVHRANTDCPHGLADHLAQMSEDLESHQQKEERMLFPMMLAGGRGMTGLPIRRMLVEHEEVGAQLERLAELTGEFEPPQGACTTWRALYQACRKLDEDLREHMHLENNVLFPQFARAL